MARGKYSPTAYVLGTNREFNFNAKGMVPAEYDKGVYDEESMYGGYDSEGYDSYGYSAYDADGKFVGCGSGIDRLGNTEQDYLCMGDTDWDSAHEEAVKLSRDR